MTALVLRASRLKYALLLVVACAFVATGIFIVLHASGSDAWAGWANIVFFGACGGVFAWQLLDARPRIVIDDAGVFDRTLGVGVIPWPEITGASVKSVLRNDFIALELRRPERWLVASPLRRRMQAANAAIGFSVLNLNLGGVAVDPRQVCALIMERIAAQPSALQASTPA